MPFKTALSATFWGRSVVLVDHLVYRDRLGVQYTVQSGFRSDLATLPPLARLFFTKLDRHAPAAVLHDACYAERMPRDIADRLFFEALADCQVGPVARGAMYLAVRTFGWWFYATKPQPEIHPLTIEVAMPADYPSSEGIEQIKEAEGYHRRVRGSQDCRAYKDQAGVWTCGWGCTEGVTSKTRWTRKEAETYLWTELDKHIAAVRRLTKVPLTRGQFDCLVSFSYNVGIGALSNSTLLKVLNRGQYEAVPAQLMRWRYHTDPDTKAKVENRGLRNRRMREVAMWHGEHLEDHSFEEETPTRVVVAENGSQAEAVKVSWTISGALASMVGAVVVGFNKVIEFGLSAATEAAGASSITKVLGPFIDAKTIGVIVVFAGAAIVIDRRLKAAREVKVG